MTDFINNFQKKTWLPKNSLSKVGLKQKKKQTSAHQYELPPIPGEFLGKDKLFPEDGQRQELSFHPGIICKINHSKQCFHPSVQVSKARRAQFYQSFLE